MKNTKENTSEAVILFDGVCNLCNGSVQFILLRDPRGYFQFASLQSDFGQQKMLEFGLDPEKLDTIILIENNQVYTHSTAPLRIARKLSGLWPMLYAFSIIPKFIRDRIYAWIARNRYRWFGKQESCMLPQPEWRGRFLG